MNIRAKNLDLIRWINGGQENTAAKLSDVTNYNYISKMATGDMEISDNQARKIERIMSLPNGWMDRENLSMLLMKEADFKIYTRIKEKTETAKNGLLAFLESSCSS